MFHYLDKTEFDMGGALAAYMILWRLLGMRVETKLL